MVNFEALLGAAVANNAMWCEAVCRSHGYPGQFSTRLWLSPHHDLELYPNAITLRPDVTAPETAPPRTVGYEHGTGLAAARKAGGQALGPLRVWTRDLAP